MLSGNDAEKTDQAVCPFAPYISEEIWHRLYPIRQNQFI